MNKGLSLTDLGYDDFFEPTWQEHKSGGEYSLARVTAEHRKAYTVKDTAGEYLGAVTGKQMHEAQSREDFPAVGDWVVIEKIGEDKATIHFTLPRKTVLKRKYNNKNDMQIIAANVDYAFVVESLGRDYSLNRFERYFVLAKEGGVIPVAILNKTDNVSKEELETAVKEITERFPEVTVLTTSAISGDGLDKLKSAITKGQTYCFLGSSGVGKSSLINTLLSDEQLEVREVGVHSERGKHTTTKRELFVLDNGGVVIDNPGTREVGIAESNTGIEEVFEDIEEISGGCKFSNCTHTHEPGCAVLAAVQEKEVDKSKYDNFLRLQRENEHYEMNELERRDKDRKFGKYVKKVIDEKRKYK